jgi:hypothetical protein
VHAEADICYAIFRLERLQVIAFSGWSFIMFERFQVRALSISILSSFAKTGLCQSQVIAISGYCIFRLEHFPVMSSFGSAKNQGNCIFRFAIFSHPAGSIRCIRRWQHRRRWDQKWHRRLGHAWNLGHVDEFMRDIGNIFVVGRRQKGHVWSLTREWNVLESGKELDKIIDWCTFYEGKWRWQQGPLQMHL